MWKKMNTLVAAALAVTLSACAGNAGPQSGPLPPEGPSTEVQVTNNNWADMNVYVERGGMRTRLGTVTSMTSRRFDIPRAFTTSSSSVRLVADPIGSRESHMTQPVQVFPGQTLEFTIQNHLAISTVSVF